MDQAVTNDEFQFLKKWSEMHPRQQTASPFPATGVVQSLLDAGLLRQVTRPDASDSALLVVTGYVVTEAGEDALKRCQTL